MGNVDQNLTRLAGYKPEDERKTALPSNMPPMMIRRGGSVRRTMPAPSTRQKENE